MSNRTRGICRRTAVGALVAVLAAAAWMASFAWAGRESPSPSQARPAGTFDTPIKSVTVDLGRDPRYPDNDVRDTLSCYYFPQLLVKELYIKGDIGSERLSILRRDRLPACEASHQAGERVIKYPEWNGDFWGVKGDFVFFSCPEFEQGDCSFAVYDSRSGKRSFVGDVAVSDKDGDIHMQVFSAKAGVVAKYVAAAHAGCDLYAQGADCWKKVKAKLGLKSDRIPKCKGYPAVYKEFQTDEDESMIGYPVELTLSSRPAVRSVAGPIRCWSTF